MTYPLLPIRRFARVTLGKMLQTEASSDLDVTANYLRAAHVQPDGRIISFDEEQQMWFSPRELRDYELRRGDVVVVEGGAGFGRSAFIRDDLQGWGFQNSIVRLRPFADRMNGRYLDYALQSALANATTALACSTATIPHFTAEKVAAFAVPVPLIAEQVAIADFLDRETAKIDALIAKQQRMQVALEERRRVARSQLTERNADWPLVPLRRLATSIIDCPHWTPDVVDDSAYEAVRSGCIRDAEYRPDAALLVNRETFEARLRGVPVEAGDVLFAREAPAGEACIAPEGRNLCLGQRTVLLKIDRSLIEPELVVANIYSRRVQDHFSVQMNGSTVGNLRLPAIRGTTIAVPPKHQQGALVAEYRRMNEDTRQLVARIVRLIELARERRAALITAAVTGQIPVGEAA